MITLFPRSLHAHASFFGHIVVLGQRVRVSHDGFACLSDFHAALGSPPELHPDLWVAEASPDAASLVVEQGADGSLPTLWANEASGLAYAAWCLPRARALD